MRGGVVEQGFRQVIDQAAINDQFAAVLDGELDLGFGVESRSVGPGAGGDEVAGGWETEGVEHGEH